MPSPLVAINRLITPTGTPDMVLAGGGITNSALTMTVDASPGVPSNVLATGLVRALIYAGADTNPEFIDIDLSSRSSLAFSIARQVEDETAYPKVAHATGAGIWFVETAEMVNQALALLAGGSISTDYVQLQDQKSSGTNGGTFTSGAWRTRDLNTKVADSGSICTLSANQFTIPAGTYRIDVWAQAHNVAQNRLRLYNITDSAMVMLGNSSYLAGGSADDDSIAVLSGDFTITSPKTFEIQHNCSATKTSDGFGTNGGFGTEIYCNVELWRGPAVTGGAFGVAALLSHQYLGYNTIGGSNESMANDKVFLKQVVVPSDGLITSIGGYMATSADQVFSMNVVLMTDNAGAPDKIIAGTNSGQSQGTGNPGFIFETSPTGPVLSPQKWVHMPIGTWVSAGTYWIGIQIHGSGAIGQVNLAYDVGTDHTDAVTVFALSDIGRFTGATTARKYSIRADFIPGVAGASLGVVQVADQRTLAQTAANAAVAAYTVGAYADESLQVAGNINVTASTTHSFSMTVAYTDETNTARTLTLTFSTLAGTLLSAITNVQGVGAYEGLPLQIRAKAGTTVTFATTGTFTSVTYNAEGTVIKVA